MLPKSMKLRSLPKGGCGGIGWNRTLLVAFLAVLGLSALTFVALAHRDYYEKLRCRRERVSEDKAYIEMNCRDPKIKVRIGATTECHLREHRVTQTPEVHAFYDVLETRQWCSSPDGCIAAISDRPIFVVYLVLITIILCAALGFVYLYQRSVSWSERVRLPSFDKKFE